MIMPEAEHIRNGQVDYKWIVHRVMQWRPMITCHRHEIVGIPSVLAAEYEHELEKNAQLKDDIKKNIDTANTVQRKRF